ncbi:MAG TPA: glycoside hydrolase family 2 TIM barrel-domain containing protein, partial [Tepidisphaeraceae bacterium]
GEAALYTSVVEILDAGGAVRHERRSRVGFRRVKLVMAPNQWDWPPIADFPKGPSNPPITLEINNRPIFAKGSNWVAPDVFPGTITENLYRAQLDMVKSANMNILRLWGGAIINKDVFYDLCDERGIMIWQEFPLACNRYEGTPEYLKVIDQESKSIITRLRFHACIVLWCGGNELFNVWSGMTPQDLALRLLNRNCYDLDPGRPFIPTSPIMGMGHGHYVMRDPKDRGEVWPLFQNAGCTAYTEFGCGGPSPVELLKTFIPEQDLFPPKFGTAWETHHALKAWMAESHLYLTDIEYYFGEVTGLEDLVEKGQLLQGEVLRGIFEESRRQKPASAMALNWCFNEPWPCAANNSLLAWRNTPKRAYFAVAEACRPVLASARIEKMKWKEAEWFTPELWLLNDAPHALPAGRIEALLALDGKEYFLLNWDHPAVEANTNLPGPKLRFKLPHGNTKRMKLILRSATHADWNTEYTLAYEPIPRPAETAGARALNQ